MPAAITPLEHDDRVVTGKDARVAESGSSTFGAEVAAPRIGPNGPVPPSGAGYATAGEQRRFDIVIRGYERTALDQHLAPVTEEDAFLRRDFAESDRRRTLAEQHAMVTESEVRGLRAAGRRDGGRVY